MAIEAVVTYQNSLQQLVWTYGTVSATAYLWGGGGAGGGSDGGVSGGNGGGGGYSEYTFTVTNGDVLELAVGGGGQPGSTGSGAGGGVGGPSYYNSTTVVSYSGGSGGASGPSGTSGSGGGSGGATVLFKNNIAVAVAGGGGGGGGAGVSGPTPPYDANVPGPWGLAGVSVTAGQNGGSHQGDGGGGGAGGGGAEAGNAGYWGGATVANPNFLNDQSGTGGSNGVGLGDVVQAPSGVFPSGTSSPYYSGSAGLGGLTVQAGQPGRAVIVFDTNPLFVNTGSSWVQPSSVYVKESGVWQLIDVIYVRQGGIWYPLVGSGTSFTTIAGNWGTFARAAPVYVPPMGMGGDSDGDTGDSDGSDGTDGGSDAGDGGADGDGDGGGE